MGTITEADLPATVRRIVAATPVIDMHTHLYPPSFGTPVPHRGEPIDPAGLMLWGLDELVTYHYLVAEVFRAVPATTLPYAQFWAMSKTEQADHIWKQLFVERTPISEACRGVVTTLTALGLDPGVKHLDSLRPWFRQQDPNQYIDRVMDLANVRSIIMTNAVFDDNERERWLAGIAPDARFRGVLRIDPLLLDERRAKRELTAWGYDPTSSNRIKAFLHDWCDRVRALYVAVSLPPEFRYPRQDWCGEMLKDAVLPVCEERNIPLAMMIGCRRGVNPHLRDAADAGGLADVSAVTALCQQFPQNRFFITMLARENQHELAVAARKFGNLMPFGCWWFLNNPSVIREMTAMRVELLGTGFIPQHSDARVLDQLLYKWRHSRAVLMDVFTEKYTALVQAGWPLTETEIQRDATAYLAGNFRGFLNPTGHAETESPGDRHHSFARIDADESGTVHLPCHGVSPC